MAKTIDDYKKDWQAAHDAGDRTGMDAAHAAAEALRAKAGYSGGTDGSQYIPIPTTKNNTTSATSTFKGSATGVNIYSDEQESIRNLMNENSKKWWVASADERNALHAENERLASLLGGSVTYDPSGTWSGSAAQVEDNQYDSKNSTQIDSLLNAILNREPFSYDYKTDPTYLAYEDKYKRLGDRAREDTLGNVAALNGGYASSWATSAASQAQNDYNQQLSDVIPTLYDAAYNRYLDEDSLKRNDLGLVMDVDNTNYDRYRDTISDSQWEQNFGLSKDQFELSEDQFEWGKEMDMWSMENTEATQEFEKLMSRWKTTGVADAEVAAALGVPVGATTESYYFNKASLAMDQRKIAMEQEEKNKTEGEQKLLEDSIVRQVKPLVEVGHFDYAAQHIFASGVTSADEYFRIGEKAGIPTVVLQEEFDALYSEAMKEPEETVEKDYLYYAGLMGKAGDETAQIAWLEANKYSIPEDIYKSLKVLLDLD